jgi:hypothetical protein
MVRALKGFIEELMIPDSVGKIKDHLRTLGAEDFKSMSKWGFKRIKYIPTENNLN